MARKILTAAVIKQVLTHLPLTDGAMDKKFFNMCSNVVFSYTDFVFYIPGRGQVLFSILIFFSRGTEKITPANYLGCNASQLKWYYRTSGVEKSERFD
jgi:hypothetical protein